MRFVTLALLAAFIIGSFTWVAAAEDTDEPAEAVEVLVNGERVELEPEPQELDGSLLVPARSVLSALGVELEWNAEQENAEARWADGSMLINPGSNVFPNGEDIIASGTTARLLDGNLFVPVEVLEEALPDQVTWDRAERALELDYALWLPEKGPETPLDINSASEEQIRALPTVNSETAEKWVNFRENNGYFEDQEQLVQVAGLKAEQMEPFEHLITLEVPAEEQVQEASGGQVVATYEGVASYYGSRFHGRTCASGETFNMHAHTAAHRNLPFGTRVEVEYPRTGRTVEVRINDRGPFHGGRIIDLSRGAADALGLTPHGTGHVILRVLN